MQINYFMFQIQKLSQQMNTYSLTNCAMVDCRGSGQMANWKVPGSIPTSCIRFFIALLNGPGIT